MYRETRSLEVFFASWSTAPTPPAHKYSPSVSKNILPDYCCYTFVRLENLAAFPYSVFKFNQGNNIKTHCRHGNIWPEPWRHDNGGSTKAKEMKPLKKTLTRSIDFRRKLLVAYCSRTRSVRPKRNLNSGKPLLLNTKTAHFQYVKTAQFLRSP